MKVLILQTVVVIAFILTSSSTISGQGCVAIRGNTSCGGANGNAFNLTKGEFNPQFGFRHFKSFRHFRGDVEETHRLEEGTEVINQSSFLDFSLNYGISDRFYANLILPFVFHNRSSMYEHGGNPPNGLGERHETSSRGLADLRLSVGYWLFDTDKKYNYAIALGVKLPTGSFDYTDTFYNQGDNKDESLEKVVDQSIQPGDGGTGVTLDILGIHPLSPNFGINTNLYYLFNFQETNGVFTRNGRSEFSCPDQYALRLGGYYNTIKGFNAYFGGRIEGVTASDIFGSSAGYRRPGYAISLEPGIGFAKNKFSVFASLPLAIYRNRTQSFEDKEQTLETGVYRHGDAAFADYLVNLGFSYRFGGEHHSMEMEVPTFKDVKTGGN